MSGSAALVTIQQVLEALDALYNSKDNSKYSRKEAGIWLETFQKTSTAWSISDSIVRQSNVPSEARLFAVQTFRQKIEYDLDELDVASRESLRDALIQLLYDNRSATKNIKTQLCLSLADLTIQLPSWTDPVSHMIQVCSNDSEMMAILFKFLSILPEELLYNNKIQIDKNVMLSQTQSLITRNSEKVLQLLLHYLPLAASDDMRCEILVCMNSWLRSGDISTTMIENTPIIDIGFQALSSSEMFDTAVDMVCEIIVRSAKKPLNTKLLEIIYPKLISLIPILHKSSDDYTVVLGICRIFAEAGERYAELIAGNMASFQALLDGLLFCVAHDELEIAKITFNVWNYIAEALLTPQYSACKLQYHPIYSKLIDTILTHLQYPDDLTTWTLQERDEFRDFRHVMGDVLKDCVRILGDEEALSRPFAILQTFFNPVNGTTSLTESGAELAWPKIEAPLFSLRAMCREISFSESRYLPEIMSILSRLPNHPKIKYAAILVIGRYAEWTNEHPEMLSYQLDYVSSAFDQDKDTISAASQTFRDLCKYCSKHLVNLLPQLYSFYVRTVESVSRDDCRQLTEAVAHIIKIVPSPEIVAAVQLFALPIAQKLHAFVGLSNEPSADQKKEIACAINQLSTLFRFILPDTPLSQPHPCIDVVKQMWPIIQEVYKRYGSDSFIAEVMSRLLQNILTSYNQHSLPLLPSIIELLLQQFELTGFSCHIWIAARCIRNFGNENTDEGRLICTMVEKMARLVFSLVQASGQNISDIDEVIEEYHMMLSEFIDTCPNAFLGSTLWTYTLECALFCLSAPSLVSLASVLRFLRDLVSLGLPSNKEPTNMTTASVRDMLTQSGPKIAKAIFDGLMYTFPRDREVVKDVAKTLQVECEILGTVSVVASVRSAIESSFLESELSAELCESFLRKFATACNEGNLRRIESVVQDFVVSYSRLNLINSRK
ncbi:hypothetical protein BDV3_000966 [Batrachochytrium dendrobatidis]|uniref:Importin N-terminal domain-containing protein n=1 Tax=Batrachochytrium dendrobatidis (strain JEL423) TaxID=403673 RepID=A0A177W961_BATDL|nr:hypothetical protein BDEG_20511 [Batrachochytrium dendrobatidis JEL423]